MGQLSEDTRLPKWAKEGAETLERQVRSLEGELAQHRDNKPSSLWYHTGGIMAPPIYIDKYDKFVIELVTGMRSSQVTFSLQQDFSGAMPYIRADAQNGKLIAESGGGANTLKLYPRELLEAWLTNSH